MALDDVIKGIAVLNQGLTDFAVSTAANDARQKLDSLTQQTNLDTNARAQAQADIGQNLMLKLQAAGAPADQIAATAARFAPSASDTAQLTAAKDLEMMKEKHSMQMQKIHMDTLLKIQQLKNGGMGGKADAAQKKLVSGFGKEFYSQHKATIDGLGKFEDVKNVLDSSAGNAIGSGLAKTTFMRAAAGRVNEMELRMADESQSAMAALGKKMNIAVTGNDPASVRAFWKKFTNKMLASTLDDLDEQITTFSQGKADQDLITEEFAEHLTKGLRNQFTAGHRAKMGAPSKAPAGDGGSPPSALKYLSPN